MSKVTSKYQVSIPKTLADKLGVRPGDELEWRLAGRELRVAPETARRLPAEERLKLFDEATMRQSTRNRRRRGEKAGLRGWTREELYDRGRSR